MSELQNLDAFWIVGIVFNLSLTSLAIWWVLRQVRPGKSKADSLDERAGDAE